MSGAGIQSGEWKVVGVRYKHYEDLICFSHFGDVAPRCHRYSQPPASVDLSICQISFAIVPRPCPGVKQQPPIAMVPVCSPPSLCVRHRPCVLATVPVCSPPSLCSPVPSPAF
uniref:Uncharacterized protein n=1 Tax=Knipowitschia caucasica TaxID=637954 RepID=A0AAV2KSB3_KNICA